MAIHVTYKSEGSYYRRNHKYTLTTVRAEFSYYHARYTASGYKLISFWIEDTSGKPLMKYDNGNPVLEYITGEMIKNLPPTNKFNVFVKNLDAELSKAMGRVDLKLLRSINQKHFVVNNI